MAFTNFIPQTRVQESQIADGFKIWDESQWSGEEALCTEAYIEVTYKGVTYDPYLLIDGVDRTKFNEYLDYNEGHTVPVADIVSGGQPIGDRFTDGLYYIKTTYNDGTYPAGSEPTYTNIEAFLASARCKARKLPTMLTWPFTEEEYNKSRDIYLQRMFLEAAEDSADLGKYVEFENILDLMNAIFDNYNISSCW